MLLPIGLPTFREALRAGAECFHALRTILHDRGLGTGQGDEGGYAPDLDRNEAAMELLMEAIAAAGYAPGRDVGIGLDPATSELYKDGHYELRGEGITLDAAGLVDRWEEWVGKYPIVSLEDGMAEDDWEGWKLLTERLGGRVQLVGDDIFVTNIAAPAARHSTGASPTRSSSSSTRSGPSPRPSTRSRLPRRTTTRA